jgi:hypothetical protein
VFFFVCSRVGSFSIFCPSRSFRLVRFGRHVLYRTFSLFVAAFPGNRGARLFLPDVFTPWYKAHAQEDSFAAWGCCFRCVGPSEHRDYETSNVSRSASGYTKTSFRIRLNPRHKTQNTKQTIRRTPPVRDSACEAGVSDDLAGFSGFC